jgi:hypothetical protein
MVLNSTVVMIKRFQKAEVIRLASIHLNIPKAMIGRVPKEQAVSPTTMILSGDRSVRQICVTL